MPIPSIPSTSAVGVRSWRRYHDTSDSRTTPEGDLILSINDYYDTDAARVVRGWAEAVGFSLKDIPSERALFVLFMRTVYEALADVPRDSPLGKAMVAVGQGGPTSLLPDFRVIVDGTFAVSCLVDTLCGPFNKFMHRMHAIDQRLTPGSLLRRF